MWISNATVIGNVDQDYTMDEWKDIFASIKVDVAGDFNEKILSTDEACFTTENIETYELNTNMTTEELNKCTTYMTNLDWNWLDGETPEAFCKGTGTNYGETFQSILDNNWSSSDQLSYFETNNIIISTGIVGIEILNYDETCGTEVVIPNIINGYPITVIGSKDGIGSFESKGITSVAIPDSVTEISVGAFENNQLTSIEIPNSVIVISKGAFDNNKLTSVTFKEPSKVEYIGNYSFENNNITSVIIPDSVTYLSCVAFDNIVSITKSSNLTCQGGYLT